MSLFNITDGIFSWNDLFEPLINIVGMSIAYSLIAMMIGAIIWKYDETGYGVTAYMAFVGLLGSFFFSSEIRLLFGFIFAMGMGMIIYRLYKSRGQE